jgi:hypothetical protein
VENCLAASPLIARLTHIRFALIAAPLLLVTVIGAYQSTNTMGDIFILVGHRLDDDGCDGVIINGVAKARPHFESAEPAKRVVQLKKNVEIRCPVMNLLRSAEVEMHVVWEARPEREAAIGSALVQK